MLPYKSVSSQNLSLISPFRIWTYKMIIATRKIPLLLGNLCYVALTFHTDQKMHVLSNSYMFETVLLLEYAARRGIVIIFTLVLTNRGNFAYLRKDERRIYKSCSFFFSFCSTKTKVKYILCDRLER